MAKDWREERDSNCKQLEGFIEIFSALKKAMEEDDMKEVVRLSKGLERILPFDIQGYIRKRQEASMNVR